MQGGAEASQSASHLMVCVLEVESGVACGSSPRFSYVVKSLPLVEDGLNGLADTGEPLPDFRLGNGVVAQFQPSPHLEKSVHDAPEILLRRGEHLFAVTFGLPILGLDFHSLSLIRSTDILRAASRSVGMREPAE